MVLLWGGTAVLGDLILLEAIPLVWYRILIAVAVIWAILRFRATPVKVGRKTLWKLFGAGCIIALHWIAFFHAIKISNVSITLACLSAGALFVSLLEPLFFRRRISWNEIFLSIAVIIGIFTILVVETAYWNGIIVALFAATLSALFSVINGLLVRSETPEVISLYELSGGVLAITVYLVAALAFGRLDPASLVPTPMDWVYLLVLGIVATAYAYIEAVSVMKHLTPFTVVLTINLEPVYGIIIAFLIFGSKEKMSPEFYLGTSLIIGAVVVNGWLKRRRTKRLSM